MPGQVTKRKVLFLIPKIAGHVSGSNLYNEQVSSYLKKHGFMLEIMSIELKSGLLLKNLGQLDQIVILDGSLLGHISMESDSRKKIVVCHGPLTAVLEHFLDFKLFDQIVFVSSDFAKDFNKKSSSQYPSSIISPGINHLQVQKSKAKNTHNFISIGTIGPDKGQDLIIKSLALINQTNWHLHLVGDVNSNTDYVLDLKNTIKRLRLIQHVTIHGELDQNLLSAVLAESTLYIVSSPYESFGIAIFEALVSEVPVVNCSEGAPRNYIQSHQGWQISYRCPIILGNFLRHWSEGKINPIKPTLPKANTWEDSGEQWARLLSSF